VTCIALVVIAGWYALASAVTFVAYGWDKHRARADGWRLTERTLHALELAGGWPGAMLGQRRFRHKWKKAQYMLAFRLIVAVHALFWALVAVLWVRSWL
jgi:uncharacterized membrane protein YsdA (DUF1294 family)